MHNKPIESVQPPKCDDIQTVKGIEKQLNNLTIEDADVKDRSKIINNNNNAKTNNNHNDNHIDNNNKVQSLKIINDTNNQHNGDSHDNVHGEEHDDDTVCSDDENIVDVCNGNVKHSTPVSNERKINDDSEKNDITNNGNTNGNSNRNKSSKSGNKLIRSDALRTASISPLPTDDDKDSLSEETKDKNSLEFFFGLDPKDRLFILGIENTILDHYTRACDEQKKALEDKNNSSPPPLFSAPPLLIQQSEAYKRMLIHRVCDYYRLVRTVEEGRKVIIYNNKPEPSEPFEHKTTLKEHFNERRKVNENLKVVNGAPVNRKILKRGDSGSTANGSIENGNSSGLGSSTSGNGLSSGSSNSTSFESASNDNSTNVLGSAQTGGFVNEKAHEEKAQRYEQVRSKIFQQDSGSDNNKVQTNGVASYNDRNSLKRSSQQNNYNNHNNNSYQRRSSPRQSIGYQQQQQQSHQQQQPPNNYQSYGNNHNGHRRLIGKQVNNLNNNSKKNHSPTSSSASSNGSRNRFTNQQQQHNSNNQYHNQQFIPKNHLNFYQHPQQNRYRGYLNQYNAQQQPIPSNGNHYVQQQSNANGHNHPHNHNSSSLYSGTNALLPMPLNHYPHAGQAPLLAAAAGQGTGPQYGSQRQQRQQQQTMQQQPLMFNTIPQSQLQQQAQAQAQAGQLSMHQLQTAQAHLLSQAAMYNYHPAQVLPNSAGVYSQATAPGLPSAGNILAGSTCATAASLSSGVGTGLQPGQDMTTVGHHQVPGTGAIYYPMFSPLQTVPFTPVPGMQTLAPGSVEQRDITHAGFANPMDEQNFFRQQQQQFPTYY